MAGPGKTVCVLRPHSHLRPALKHGRAAPFLLTSPAAQHVQWSDPPPACRCAAAQTNDGFLAACVLPAAPTAVEWSSSRMTSCGGTCELVGGGAGGARIKLSEPLLKVGERHWLGHRCCGLADAAREERGTAAEAASRASAGMQHVTLLHCADGGVLGCPCSCGPPGT